MKEGKECVLLTLFLHLVGMTGFEPATPVPPERCANQTALHPDSEKMVAYGGKLCQAESQDRRAWQSRDLSA